MTPITRIRQVRCFDDPINEALHLIWDVIAETIAPAAILDVFRNPGAALSHAQCLQRIHAEEREMESQFWAFIEADFLPELSEDWLFAEYLVRHGPAFTGTMYATRGQNIEHGPLFQYSDMAGGWFFIWRKDCCPPRVAYHGAPDPCNQIPEQLAGKGLSSQLFPGQPSDISFAIRYPFGLHLFFSRHYGDDPSTRICGVPAGQIQVTTRKEIISWVRRQPRKFQALLKSRIPSAGSLLSSAFTNSTDTSDQSWPRLGS